MGDSGLEQGRYNIDVTVKEELHRVIEGLPEDHARELLDDPLDAADVDGPALDQSTLASLERGLSDISAGRVISLEDFEKQHSL
jgi:hypothetical protein